MKVGDKTRLGACPAGAEVLLDVRDSLRYRVTSVEGHLVRLEMVGHEKLACGSAYAAYADDGCTVVALPAPVLSDADLRAHVGDLEEERNQARENEAVALRDLNDIEKRLDEALERASVFESALLVVLKMRESGNDENIRRIGALITEAQDAKTRNAETFRRTIERCAAVTRERALGATPGDIVRNIETRIRALAYEP